MVRTFGSPKLRLNLLILYVANLVVIYFQISDLSKEKQ